MITNLLKVIYVNKKVRCKPRNATDFNQKVRILKTLNFRYDTETSLCQKYTTIHCGIVLTKSRLLDVSIGGERSQQMVYS